MRFEQGPKKRRASQVIQNSGQRGDTTMEEKMGVPEAARRPGSEEMNEGESGRR